MVLRTFVAVELPQEACRELARVAAELARPLPPGVVRWVNADAMHLTLRFLGDTLPAQLPLLAERLTRAAATAAPLALQLGEIGTFPPRLSPRNPLRVIWAGLQGEVGSLAALQTAVEQTVVALGWPAEERPFAPHLTLGRVKDPRRLPVGAWPERPALAPHTFRVTACHLIRSELRPQGPLYTTLHTFPLGKTDHRPPA